MPELPTALLILALRAPADGVPRDERGDELIAWLRAKYRCVNDRRRVWRVGEERLRVEAALRVVALPIAAERLRLAGFRVSGEQARLPPHGGWLPLADALAEQAAAARAA